MKGCEQIVVFTTCGQRSRTILLEKVGAIQRESLVRTNTQKFLDFHLPAKLLRKQKQTFLVVGSCHGSLLVRE